MRSYYGAKLYVAVLEGDIQQVKRLMSQGANVNYVFRDHGDTLLHNAHTAEVANFLLATMAKTNVRDKYGQTPLCCAVARPNGLGVAKELLAAGADVNVKVLNGKTPLHYAPTLEMTKLLLQYGAQVNAKDKYGRTPLHSALIEHKGLEVFKCLLAAGADIKATVGTQKLTVLHYADSLDIIKEILNRGFDINVTTTQKQTPLHLAVKHMKDIAIIHELLKRGAKIDLRDSENDIASWFAIRNYKKDYAVIQLLIEYGTTLYELFYDHKLNRRANSLGYMVSRDMELAKLIAKVHLIRTNGDVEKMAIIGTDACPKRDRDYILDYINKSAKEIVELKKYKIFGKYTLFNVLADKKILMKPVYKNYRQFEKEMASKFPHFHGLIMQKIRPYLMRGCLLNRLKGLHISVTNAKKKVLTIKPDCTRIIIQMLPDESLSNLLIASEI